MQSNTLRRLLVQRQIQKRYIPRYLIDHLLVGLRAIELECLQLVQNLPPFAIR